MKPLGTQTSKTMAKLIICLIWVCSLTLASPLGFFYDLRYVQDEATGKWFYVAYFWRDTRERAKINNWCLSTFIFLVIDPSLRVHGPSSNINDLRDIFFFGRNQTILLTWTRSPQIFLLPRPVLRYHRLNRVWYLHDHAYDLPIRLSTRHLELRLHPDVYQTLEKPNARQRTSRARWVYYLAEKAMYQIHDFGCGGFWYLLVTLSWFLLR